MTETGAPDFERLFESVPAACLVLRADAPRFTIVAVSDAYLAATMTSREAIVGRPMFDVFPDPPGDEGATGTTNLRASLERARASGSADRMPVQHYPIQRPDGSWVERFWSPLNTPVADPRGTVSWIVHQVSDVTEILRLTAEGDALRAAHALSERARLSAEALNVALEMRTAEAERARLEIQEVRGRLRDTLEAISDPFFTVDRDWRFTYVNPAAAAVVGRARDELLGRGLWDEFPAAIGTPYHDNAMLAVRERRAVDFEAYYPAPLDLWTAMRIYPLSRDGEPDGMAVYYQDITARKRAEDALAESEQQFRNLFEQAPIAVAMLSGPDLVYTIVSPLYAHTPGGGRTLIGLPVRQAFPELPPDYFDTMEAVYRTAIPFYADERKVVLQPPEGGPLREYFFNVGYQPLRNGAGEVYAIASVAFDVTAQVLARREVELARAAAVAANEAKSVFLSTMSHELRTPLNAIQGYTELLRTGIRGELSDVVRLDLDRIQRANQHLMSLITDVLNFARLESGRVEFREERVDVSALIGDLETLVGPQLDAKGLTLSLDGCAADGTPHVVTADAEKLGQVLLNLMTNAVKFTDAGGRITLTCDDDRASETVRIAVADTGRGIPAGQLERIFEPFVQIDRHRTHASQQGVGLGLAISRDLARAMGGELVAESVEGKGSTFTVTLRRAAQ